MYGSGTDKINGINHKKDEQVLQLMFTKQVQNK